MASILSHPAVALGLGAGLGLPPRFLIAGAACTVIPDLDALGFFAGIPYDHQLGHRGLTHSVAFAAVLGAGALAILHQQEVPRRLAYLYLFLCAVSHGLLDAMTDGGLGVAFLAPFSGERFFFPFRPIAVSPIGVLSFFNARGLAILRNELVWIWLPSGLLGLVVWLARLLLRRFG